MKSIISVCIFIRNRFLRFTISFGDYVSERGKKSTSNDGRKLKFATTKNRSQIYFAYIFILFLFVIIGCETGRQLIIDKHDDPYKIEEKYINESSKEILNKYGFFNHITDIINNDTQYFNGAIKNETEKISAYQYATKYIFNIQSDTYISIIKNITKNITKNIKYDTHIMNIYNDTYTNTNEKNLLNYEFKNIAVDNITELEKVLKKISGTSLKKNIDMNIIYVGIVEFKLNNTEIDSSFFDVLTKFNTLIYSEKYRKYIDKLIICGNTDDLEFSDTAAYDNWNLSKERADTVQKYFNKKFAINKKNNEKKIDSKIQANSHYFPYYNIADKSKNKSINIDKKINEARQKNRRVDIIIYLNMKKNISK